MIHVHGWDISQQMVVTGAAIGLSYSAIAASGSQSQTSWA